jgi:hypothetical protein
MINDEILREAREIWRRTFMDMVNDQRVDNLEQCIDWANAAANAYLKRFSQ